jgi:hypothetical protein
MKLEAAQQGVREAQAQSQALVHRLLPPAVSDCLRKVGTWHLPHGAAVQQHLPHGAAAQQHLLHRLRAGMLQCMCMAASAALLGTSPVWCSAKHHLSVTTQDQLCVLALQPPAVPTSGVRCCPYPAGRALPSSGAPRGGHAAGRHRGLHLYGSRLHCHASLRPAGRAL